jgi:hypothetical protein
LVKGTVCGILPAIIRWADKGHKIADLVLRLVKITVTELRLRLRLRLILLFNVVLFEP